MVVRNPFKASLGANPYALVGRDDVLAEMEFALDNGPGTHERVSVIVGPRGIGKTVTLNAIEQLALERGWRYFSETATEGFSERLRTAIIRVLLQLSPPRSSINGIQLGHVGISTQKDDVDTPPLDLRAALTELLAAQHEESARVHQEPTGVLIILDELHHLSASEIVEFAAVIQHLIREDANIAVVFAGIPSSVSSLLSDEAGTNPITFLRRANRINLGPISDDAVEIGLTAPTDAIGVTWNADALARAVTACGGYPFMVQLVGQWSFFYRSGTVIDLSAAEKGIAKAQEKLGILVHEPALADLSPRDREFLLAMAEDDGPSTIGDIAERTGMSASNASNYRRRLLDAQIIAQNPGNTLTFTLPYLREYLRTRQ